MLWWGGLVQLRLKLNKTKLKINSCYISKSNTILATHIKSIQHVDAWLDAWHLKVESTLLLRLIRVKDFPVLTFGHSSHSYSLAREEVNTNPPVLDDVTNSFRIFRSYEGELISDTEGVKT